MCIDTIWHKFLKEGDTDSFSIIYNRYINELYTYGLYLGYEGELCKDAIQDVYYKLYVSRKELKGIKQPASYLFRSFKNRLIDIYRKNAHTENIDLTDRSFPIQVTVLDDMITEEDTQLLKKRVELLLESLSGHQRETIYLRYMLDLDYQQIGKILNIHPDSARKLTNRAIIKMRTGRG
jgi:RNA polymerase sigma factor (sigma-70 family)